ncbi:DUF4145 domain-containing protein [Rhizobium leguminosarum]|uniref:DUF4145 domain-containing protein n=1 Tax=Rhizobium leguminosarum TaxID=384 RepID=UPI001CDD14C0|nr:DUF4145 domain-containing protein [Rhizobium leguminosarum]
MYRNLWRKTYSSFVRMKCPRCGKGTLTTKKDSFVHHEPTHASRELEEDDLVGEMSWGRFSGYLTCNVMLCGELVVVAGDYREYYHVHIDNETGDPVDYSDMNYTPLVMYPAPPMIELPKALQKEARAQMTKAFELFWSDGAACANRLRIVVELLLDQLGIPRKGAKGKAKNARLNLSDRIDLLKIARPGHEKALTALREVGNTGSHEGEVELEELLDCFELLEDAMIELLEQRRAKLDAKADAIIQKRQKPSA